MTIINCTPHTINFNNGTSIGPCGNIARVVSEHTIVGCKIVHQCTGGIDDHEHAVYCGCPEQGNGWTIPSYSIEYGEVTDLPASAVGAVFIVSSIVLAAVKAQGRTDCCAPATGHHDCIRNDKGHIVSVPGLVF